MAGLPPPEGMTEDDYGSIHEAVVETVRGRWFLAEYARRSRVDEVQEMLAAIGRLEQIVTGSKALPPPHDSSPHLRLLAQRVDEIATHLTRITEDLRESGADPYLCDELDTQARAIAGLPRGVIPDSTSGHSAPSQQALASSPKPMIALEARASNRSGQDTFFPEQLVRPAQPLHRDDPLHEKRLQDQVLKEEASDLMPLRDRPLTDEPLAIVPPPPIMPRAAPLRVSELGDDPRLAALRSLDRLSMAEKLALFS